MIPKYSYIPHRRRRGQALLLAILVMVFAALIGITFITVVAMNIGQTGREEERDKARLAAQAGLEFANHQLTYSANGLRWNPADPSRGGMQPPASSDPSYYAYWTPFDQAQGWHNAGFVKFPDPRSTNPSQDAPNYMVKVEKVEPNDFDNTDGDKTDALRITTIGLSTDDPTSFYRIVAYKAGPKQTPLTGAMRSVSNWNFQDNGVPSARALGNGSGTSMQLQDITARFPSKDFYVVIGDGRSGGTLTSAYVTSASSNTLTFAQPVTWSDNDHVEVAATLGAPQAIDYNNDGTAEVDINLEISSPGSVDPGVTPGSSWINGGLIVSGNTFFKNLLDPKQAITEGKTAGQIRASGLIHVADANLAKVDGRVGAATDLTDEELVSSNVSTFPFINSNPDALKVVSDGANRIANSPESVRQNRPFTPANLTKGGDGFGRYRQMTKHSRPASPGLPPQAAAYGYGEGIYIDNPEDKERKAKATSATQFPLMSQEDLIDLWYNSEEDTTSPSNTPARRLSEPRPITNTNASLEEMHLRGWVGPNEFLPRGAQIELDPENNQVHITLDARSDGRDTVGGVLPLNGPVPNKGWREANGDLEGSSDGGVYRKSLAWPVNGVIFAEGNLRVRGGVFNNDGSVNTAVDPGRSLTIVSMNNIYIEGSLNAGARKVLLLAKRNVVVNPTAAIQKAEAFTRLTADANTTDTITVADASNFRVGDEVVIRNNNNIREIRTINLSSNQITLNEETTATPVAGDVVQLAKDGLRGDTRVFHNYATRIERVSDILHRRIYLPNEQSNGMRLALRHSAERRTAFSVTTQQAQAVVPPVPQLESATLTHKLAANGADQQTTIIQPFDLTNLTELGDKAVRIDFGDTDTTGTLTFPANLPANDAAALAYILGTPTLETGATTLRDDMDNRRQQPNWKVAADILNNYADNSDSPIKEVPPAHFLAAVGNRSKLFDLSDATSYPFRKNVFVGETYEIPIATSVVLKVNGTQAPIRSDRYVDTADAYERVLQFGFNPAYLGETTPTENNVENWEDVLTADETFYHNGSTDPADKNKADYDNSFYRLDSRVLEPILLKGWNSLALKLHPAAEKYFMAPPAPNPHMPYYRLSRLKLENVDQLNDEHEFERLEPGYTFQINAYVYAQEGSWNIIPGGYFDDTVRTDSSGAYIDLNDNGARDPGEGIDLNGDGVISRGEQVAAYRFRRYNYQINFTGAIMENRTAHIYESDGTTPGPVADWVDKWTTVQLNDTHFAGTGSGDAFEPGSLTAEDFSSIRYTFDPEAALGLIAGDPLEEDTGFHLPVSSELLYQTG